MRTIGSPRGSPRIRLLSSFAMLALVIGGVAVYSVRKTGELFDIGVDDHLRCAVAGTFPQQPQGLGTQFAAMLQPVLDAAGTDYATVSAHRCNVDDRAYIHIILRQLKQSQTLVSVILTRRGDQEVFPRALSGPLHEGKRDGYSVAAFQSGAYLVYIVSALPGAQNAALAARVAPVIERYTKP
jgi:hypothetical protein